MSESFFTEFVDERFELGEVELRVRHARGTRLPVLLLHGHPRTSATWHRVAPQLRAAGHPVVCPDLRGYGASSKPASTPDHAPYAKRAMAADLAALMRRLGPPAVRRRRARPGQLRGLPAGMDAPER